MHCTAHKVCRAANADMHADHCGVAKSADTSEMATKDAVACCVDNSSEQKLVQQMGVKWSMQKELNKCSCQVVTCLPGFAVDVAHGSHDGVHHLAGEI